MKQPPLHTILLISDTDQLDALASTIELAEYNVLKATTANVRVELATEQQPDLIILDVSKDKSPFRLHRRIRSTQELTNTPILVLTTPATSTDFLDSTKDDRLESPFH